MLYVRQALLLKMALKFSFKLTERLYLSNGSRDGVVSSSAVSEYLPSIVCRGRGFLKRTKRAFLHDQKVQKNAIRTTCAEPEPESSCYGHW